MGYKKECLKQGGRSPVGLVGELRRGMGVGLTKTVYAGMKFSSSMKDCKSLVNNVKCWREKLGSDYGKLLLPGYEDIVY